MTADETETHRRRRAAVERTLREVHKDFFRFLLRQLKDEHDAADVLQEFYVRVLKSFADLKDDEKLRPWMNRVLQSVIADHYRLRARSERLEKAFERQMTVESQMVEEEIDLLVCACLYKLLPTLVDDYAAIIWRVDLLGEDRADVRDSLELSESAFRVKLHRARQALRDRLEQSCRTCPEHGFLDCGCEEVKSIRRRFDKENFTVQNGES